MTGQASADRVSHERDRVMGDIANWMTRCPEAEIEQTGRTLLALGAGCLAQSTMDALEHIALSLQAAMAEGASHG